ncbi:hypothetical protein [Hankyongella ginsenosidimutans]|uniref:hypothetical protein n=1 Tax=Hankyongella ginsenosidimutans TaxID=1763828 RepID=UPI001FE65607|nr:hypothetical protein [Hankyongella ginsenosidimutans]
MIRLQHLRALPERVAGLPLAVREVLMALLGALSALAFAPLCLLPLMGWRSLDCCGHWMARPHACRRSGSAGGSASGSLRSG